jgi:hypothetical protein
MKRMTKYFGVGLIWAMVAGGTLAFAQTGGITIWPKGMPLGGIKERAHFGDHLLEISHCEVDGNCE